MPMEIRQEDNITTVTGTATIVISAMIPDAIRAMHGGHAKRLDTSHKQQDRRAGVFQAERHDKPMRPVLHPGVPRNGLSGRATRPSGVSPGSGLTNITMEAASAWISERASRAGVLCEGGSQGTWCPTRCRFCPCRESRRKIRSPGCSRGPQIFAGSRRNR